MTADFFHRLFFEGVSPIRLDAYRRCLSTSFAIYMAYLFLNAGEWLTSAGFHVTAKTQLLHAATPWPTMDAWLVPFFGVALFGSSLCLIFGKWTRIATLVALACAIYVHRIDSLSAFALNKLFIVGFTVLALSPAPRRITNEDGTVELLQSVWPVRVLQATLLIIYFTSGVCKGYFGDWLRDPDVVWTIVQGVFRTDFSSFMLRTFPKPVFTASMYAVLAFEVFAPVLFIDRRLRRFAIVGGIIFHLSLAAMMSTVIFFSLQMITYYVLFFSEETLETIYRWFTPDRLRTVKRVNIEAIVHDGSASDAQKLGRIAELLED